MKYTRVSTFSVITPTGTEIVLGQLSEDVDEHERHCHPFRPVGMGSGREVHTNLWPSDIAFINANRTPNKGNIGKA